MAAEEAMDWLPTEAAELSCRRGRLPKQNRNKHKEVNLMTYHKEKNAKEKEETFENIKMTKLKKVLIVEFMLLKI